jgi:hypothetical protein
MASGNQRELPRDLARARDQLTAWRRTKKPRSRIPQRLWELAVKLAAKHGLHRTAQALKLDYYSLKKRVEAVEPGLDEGGPAFIELPSALAAVQECVIELEDGAVSLRVSLKGCDAADIATVGRSVRDSQ